MLRVIGFAYELRHAEYGWPSGSGHRPLEETQHPRGAADSVDDEVHQSVSGQAARDAGVLARVGPDAAPHDGDVIEDRPWSRRVDYWYTFCVSHPCPMTVRSELNHESLNTTHSPSLMRVVVEQPASAMIATTSRVFILAPSPCLDVPRASGALPRQWTSLYHQARGVPSGNAGPVTSFHGSPASSRDR